MSRDNRNRAGYRRKNQGIITVFVVLIMVPTVVITGLMVDIARLKLFQAQAAMAADSYGNIVLSEYDNVLKELYGLFAVTQNEEGQAAIEELKKYTTSSFHPNGNGMSLTGAMLFDSAEMEDKDITYEGIENSKLTNENVFLTQIADFMEFREIEQILDESGLFGSLTEISKMEKDSEAVAAVTELGDESSEVLKGIKAYYETLEKIQKYEDYLVLLNGKLAAYVVKLEEIVKSDEYKEYREYVKNPEKEAIDAAHKKQEKNEEELTEEETALAEKWVDTQQMEDTLEELENLSKMVRIWKSKPVDFENIEGLILELGRRGENVEKKIAGIAEQVNTIRNEKLPSCTEDVKISIEEEMKDIEKITELKGKFSDLAEKEQQNIENNKINKKVMERVCDDLDAVKEELKKGEREPDDVTWNKTWTFVWADVSEIGADIWKLLSDLCKQDDSTGDKNAADNKKKEAEDTLKEMEDKSESEEYAQTVKPRDIPSDVMGALDEIDTSGKLPSWKDRVKDGLSMKDFSDAGTAAFDKFLLTEYDYGMFSSRVTGTSKEEGKREPIEECSLTKIEKSADINYLYGAELEYLLGGNKSSSVNLLQTQGAICGVRMVANMISTYTIPTINTQINLVATEAAIAATAGTFGLGAAAAPLIRIAVSTALRLAIAGMETWEDWKALMEREDVLFYKNSVSDLKCVESLGGLLNNKPIDKTSAGKQKLGLKLSYEDYLRILLFIMVDDENLIRRTQNLITLNVNQSQREEKDSEMTKADIKFQMDAAYTAIKSTCKAKLEFVVVPDRMMNLFLNGNETQSQINAYDDGYAAYSVIRGY